MPKSNIRRRGDRPTYPAPIGPRDPESWDRIQNVLVGHDHWIRALETTWGIGRLAALVSDDTRAKFRRGMTLWQAAVASADPDEIERLAPMIRKTLEIMQREARTAGHAELSPVVWEVQREDGAVIAIVRTQAEATAVAAEGREIEIWTLAEISRVLPKLVSDVKQSFPGARVERLTSTDEGDALDWATADPARDDLMLG